MDLLDKIRHLHHEAAKAIVEDGPWELHCRRCGGNRADTKGAVVVVVDGMAEYLRSGWPKCCGETMELRRVK